MDEHEERPDGLVSLDVLIPDPRNARTHNDRNLAQIEAALREVGAGRSIVVDETGTILAGNATVQAVARAGLTRIPVEYRHPRPAADVA